MFDIGRLDEPTMKRIDDLQEDLTKLQVDVYGLQEGQRALVWCVGLLMIGLMAALVSITIVARGV